MTIEEQIDIAIVHLTDIKKIIDEKLSNLQKAKAALSQETDKPEGIQQQDLDELVKREFRVKNDFYYLFLSDLPTSIQEYLRKNKVLSYAGYDYKYSKSTKDGSEREFCNRFKKKEQDKK